MMASYLVISSGRWGVSNICFTWSTLVMIQVCLVKDPRGSASFRTKEIVELGSRFFFDPPDILSRKQSKNI